MKKMQWFKAGFVSAIIYIILLILLSFLLGYPICTLQYCKNALPVILFILVGIINLSITKSNKHLSLTIYLLVSLFFYVFILGGLIAEFINFPRPTDDVFQY